MSERRLLTWRELYKFASPEEEERELAFARDAPSWKKWQIMAELSQRERKQGMATVQEQYPKARPDEVRDHFVAALYGEELAKKVAEYLAKREKMADHDR